MASQRYLVTGGAGFIGRALVARLTACGHKAIVLDDFSAGRRDLLGQDVRVVEGDIRDTALLNELIAKVDGVFHLAACVSVQSCIREWQSAHAVNLGGTIKLFKAAQAAGNRPVVYASSAAIYGRGCTEACDEGTLPQPISPYGADKLGAEHQAAAFAEIHGLTSVGLRFFNVYGPGQDPTSPYAGVIARFIRNRRDDCEHQIYGDGLQSRDFVHVGDVVAALTAAMENCSVLTGAHVVNVCTGIETSLLDLIGILDRVSGRPPLANRHHPHREGDIVRSVGCPVRAEAVLGFRAVTDLSSGLADLWQRQATSVRGSV